MNYYKEKIPQDSAYHIIYELGENNNVQYLKSDYSQLNDYLKNNQKDPKKIITLLEKEQAIDKLLKIEKEINAEKINSNMKAHGIRHILNVVLYSLIIGLNQLNKEDLELLLIAAKYHDVGRTEDNWQEHGYLSALLARKKLNSLLPEDEINIVTTAIEFHEVPRKTIYEDQIFNDISQKNGVKESQLERARIISEILKDADALDRTRFVNRARLDNRYLKYDISKQLIKFSANIQEKIAKQELSKYELDSEIKTSYYTPQEILRKIRKNEYYEINKKKMR